MKYLKFTFCFCLLLFSNCLRDTNPFVLDPDEYLQEKIIGEWSRDNLSTFIFHKDMTFKTLQYSTENDSLFLHYIIEGKYVIEDGIISFNNFEFTYMKDQSGMAATSTSLLKGKLRFENNKLFILRFEVLTPQHTTIDEIWGIWETRNWRAVYEFSNDTNYTGYQKDTYLFHPDSTSCFYQCEYLFYCPILTGRNRRYDFTYNPPYLNLFKDKIIVEFKNTKMYWHYDDEPRVYNKINKHYCSK